jgi:uncharacterized protein
MARAPGKPRRELSAREARWTIVRAQGLDRCATRKDGVDGALRRLGAVQLDTISVLARSHELVAYARLGAIPRAKIERAYWGEPARAFEYVGHAGCILPLELWPYFAFRRRALRARERGRLDAKVFREVRARLRDGPVATSDLGGSRRPGGWWNWSEAKIAIEILYRRGEVVVTARRGWKRIYDLPERALPAELLDAEPTDEECYAHLIALSARAVGVGTFGDIANYFYLLVPYSGAAVAARRLARSAMDAAGLVPVTVEGWSEPAFADPKALSRPPAEPSRVALLSPFDSLVWSSSRAGELRERERIRRIFGFSYCFEAYVPEAKRTHGYFVMPLLAGGRLVGRVDPARSGKTLLAKRVALEDRTAAPAMAQALREAAEWVGCTDIELGEVSPRGALAGMRF